MAETYAEGLLKIATAYAENPEKTPENRERAALIRDILRAASEGRVVIIHIQSSGSSDYKEMSNLERFIFDILATSMINTMNPSVREISGGRVGFHIEMNPPLSIGTYALVPHPQSS